MWLHLFPLASGSLWDDLDPNKQDLLTAFSYGQRKPTLPRAPTVGLAPVPCLSWIPFGPCHLPAPSAASEPGVQEIHSFRPTNDLACLNHLRYVAMSVSVCRAILPFLFLNKNLGGWERRGAKIHWQLLNKKWKYKVLWFLKIILATGWRWQGRRAGVKSLVVSRWGQS